MRSSWVPELRGHVIWQTAKSVTYFLAMGAIFWFLPHIVWAVLGQPPTARSRELFQYYPYVVLAAYIMSFAALESLGAHLRKFRVQTRDDLEMLAHIDAMARRAGLRRTPVLVEMKGKPNAAATWSVFKSSFLIVMGRVHEMLTTRERDAVLAHELSHVKHWDMLATTMVNSGRIALSVQTNVILFIAIVDLLTYRAIGAGEFAFAVKAWVVISAIGMLYSLLALAFSRTREYLADVGAISILGLGYRDELISGMLKVGHRATGMPLMQLMQRTGMTIFQSHPSTADRADALGVSVESCGDGVLISEAPLV